MWAHAYYPQDGRVHFDEDETFTDTPFRSPNLLVTAVHEFGHTLGLAHSNVRAAIMYPDLGGKLANLHQDDITGIQALYGKHV